MKFGSIEVVHVPDGEGRLPSEYFPNSDWSAHKALLDADGNFEISLGCFLVRTPQATVLVDAGLGPVSLAPFRGGDLPAKLAEAGVEPRDVDLVLLTHLHLDHIGWTVQDGKPYFPNATVRFGDEDLDQFIRTEDPDAFAKPVIDVLDAAGRIEPITSDGEIVPGVSTVHSPGHTLGHRHVVLSSDDRRILLLGDAVACPVQLQEADWSAMSDVDPKLAQRSREALWKELEGTEDVVTASHFPELRFGRVLVGEGKRYFS